MNFLLMTTSILNETTSRELERMILSVKVSCTSANSFKHIVLLQNYSGNLFSLEKYSSDVIFITHHEVISLSKARNKMLQYAKSNALMETVDVVAYPDDDSWYLVEFLDFIALTFELNTDLDFLFMKYSSKPSLVKGWSDLREASISDVVKNSSSNTIFIRSRVAILIGGFDESLGVGAPNNGGEDLDYSIKAFLVSCKVMFFDQCCIGHRDKDESLRGKYFRGSHIAIRRYALHSLPLFLQYMRKVAVGLVLVARKEMKFSSFKKLK